MTPEQAREIDRLAFEAESRERTKRALELLAERRRIEREQVDKCLGRTPPPLSTHVPTSRRPADFKPVPPRASRRHGPIATVHWINGSGRTLEGWATYLDITKTALHARIRKTGSLAAAIALGPRQRERGVGSVFAASLGTGGGSTAQDISQLEFSK